MRFFFAGCALVLVMLPAPAPSQTNELTPEEEKRADMRLPELDRSALEPEKRTPVDVPEGERNPFGLLSVPPPQEDEAVKIEIETEEMKIRRILGNMRVAGVGGSPGDLRVMVGSMKLAKGDTVPRLFANQAEELRVEEITERQVVLSFVERGQPQDQPPRTIGLVIDLSPRVRSLLPGEFFTSLITFDEKGGQAMEPLGTAGVDTMVEKIKTDKLTEALTEHRRALLGETASTPKNEPAAAAKTD